MKKEITKLTRKKALSILAGEAILGLSLDERFEALEDLSLECWDDGENSEWDNLPASLKADIEESEEWNVEDPRYAPAIKVWVMYRMRYFSHKYLTYCLQNLGYPEDALSYEPIEAETCPCCGYKTLAERGMYEICPVCWWEDEGFDTPDGACNHLTVEDEDGTVTEVHVPLNELGVASNEVDLLSARINFLEFGIFNPEREDLRAAQDNAMFYEQGREFVWKPETLGLSEPAIGWRVRVDWRNARKP